MYFKRVAYSKQCCSPVAFDTCTDIWAYVGMHVQRGVVSVSWRREVAAAVVSNSLSFSESGSNAVCKCKSAECDSCPWLLFSSLGIVLCLV